ncbi:MAG: S1 RNA-binding domain-containing protein [Oscillospiraceae bacterium]|jgi:small subunit ribosomal protein S1|nr:S1 RNA-binding domain-containing protein [Oscillospiraceae bacterium]
MTVYHPEGILLGSAQNRQHLRSLATLREAMDKGVILEARALVCDGGHNLTVDLGCCKGIIPRVEAAAGIAEGTTRDIAIISRVGKPVSFIVDYVNEDAAGGPVAVLSRRAAQERCRREYLDCLRPGDVIPVMSTHMENFGCFVDVGCGITSLIPIDAISISRIAHPGNRFYIGQELLAAVRHVDESGRITLTHKELLGTWEENAAKFSIGETVTGIIRSVEPYGIFVELTPNLAGLAEPREGISPGRHASVYIKNLLPDRMKVKFIIVDTFDVPGYAPPPPEYFIREGRITRWRYSPPSSPRVMETVFAG